jgi:hypothetical protein
LKFLTEEDNAGSTQLRDNFEAEWAFDGSFTIPHAYHCITDQARSIASAWIEKNAKELKLLQWRYRKIKEIGRRSLLLAGVSPRHELKSPLVPATASEKTGRNDPCPCGSGRKYKKCCGR